MTRLTVWHDGDCPLCRREIAIMRRLDRRGAIEFVDATSPDATCPIDRRALLARNPLALRLMERAYLGFLVVRPRLQRLLGGRDAV